MPAPIAARAEDLWMLIAMAAATEMPPPLVDADGVASAPPSPAPPFALDAPDAFARSPCTWPSTLWVPELSSAGAPAADAVASSVDDEVFVALMAIAPPALMPFSEYASAVWLLILRASAMPTAALLPVVAPDAVVCELALFV